MDENMKKWPQTKTGSQTGTLTLLLFFIMYLILTISDL